MSAKSKPMNTIPIDTNFAADSIIDNLRAMECDEALAREILALCHMRITRGDLRRRGHAAASAPAQ